MYRSTLTLLTLVAVLGMLPTVAAGDETITVGPNVLGDSAPPQCTGYTPGGPVTIPGVTVVVPGAEVQDEDGERVVGWDRQEHEVTSDRTEDVDRYRVCLDA